MSNFQHRMEEKTEKPGRRLNKKCFMGVPWWLSGLKYDIVTAVAPGHYCVMGLISDLETSACHGHSQNIYIFHVSLKEIIL